MMWGYGNGMGWMWLWGVLLLVGIALLVLVAIRMFGGYRGGYGPGAPEHPGPQQLGRSRARQILDERFARGELTAEQYREHLRVLGEGP